jgi:betaine reductase
MKQIKVVHYLNQFFAQIGGEEKADIPPESKSGPVGPGMAFKGAFGDAAEIVATVACGDSYFNENPDVALAAILDMIASFEPDIVVCGPAFNAGRYGVACGAVATGVREKLNIPAITGMYVENPGVDLYKQSVHIVSTKDNAAGMRDAVALMVPLALKLARGEEIGTAAEEGYIPMGIRKNFFDKKRGSRRAVDMLLKKMAGEPYETEFPMPDFDRVVPNPAVKDISKAKIALVTSGGIVPKGNPDRIESSSASKYGKYDLEGIRDLDAQTYETAHGGYDPVYANEDADRVLPVDILREFEKEGKIGSLSRYFYSTVGNGTAVASAKKYARAIGEELVADGVDAVILTST